MSTTATQTATARPARRGRRGRRLAGVALAAALLSGAGALATAGAAAASEPSTVHTADGRSVDALKGTHGDGFGADGSYDPHAHLVWWAAGERFTESHHDGCNPYTFIDGGVQTDPHCPVGQVKADWNVDFAKDALQQAGFRTYTIDDADLTTFRGEGVGEYAPFTAQHQPAAGDSIFWTDASGVHGTVGIVLEATSAHHVKVVVGDLRDSTSTQWIDPATSKVGGKPVTGYVTPTYVS